MYARTVRKRDSMIQSYSLSETCSTPRSKRPTGKKQDQPIAGPVYCTTSLPSVQRLQQYTLL